MKLFSQPRSVVWSLALLAGAAVIPAPAAEPSGHPHILYTNNFQKAELNALPEDFLVLDGAFAVKEENQNRFIELPGTPLETFGLLFGPSEKSGLRVTARFLATARGRRQPSFSLGLGGTSGFRLTVAPGRQALEISRHEETKASGSFPWTSGAWTFLSLQIRQEKPNLWKVEGKAWPEGKPEPAEWLVSFSEMSEPPNGRAGIWGTPYSGTAIRFDDFQVVRISEAPK
jgi:hypothetical protein